MRALLVICGLCIEQLQPTEGIVVVFDQLRTDYRTPKARQAVEWLLYPETYPGLAPWRVQDTRLRLVELPAFDAYSGWVVQEACEGLARVRRVRWDRGADWRLGAALPALAPSTFGADGELAAAALQELLGALGALRLAPFESAGDRGIVLDGGGQRALAVGQGWEAACFCWREPVVGSWEPLGRWFEGAVAACERALPASSLGGDGHNRPA